MTVIQVMAVAPTNAPSSSDCSESSVKADLSNLVELLRMLAVLACLGMSWHVLVCLGMSWHVLACLGMSLHVLACLGMSWHVLASRISCLGISNQHCLCLCFAPTELAYLSPSTSLELASSDRIFTYCSQGFVWLSRQPSLQHFVNWVRPPPSSSRFAAPASCRDWDMCCFKIFLCCIQHARGSALSM